MSENSKTSVKSDRIVVVNKLHLNRTNIVFIEILIVEGINKPHDHWLRSLNKDPPGAFLRRGSQGT